MDSLSHTKPAWNKSNADIVKQLSEHTCISCKSHRTDTYHLASVQPEKIAVVTQRRSLDSSLTREVPTQAQVGETRARTPDGSGICSNHLGRWRKTEGVLGAFEESSLAWCSDISRKSHVTQQEWKAQVQRRESEMTDMKGFSSGSTTPQERYDGVTQ